MLYDLLLKGGMLVDPAQGIHAVHDVAFAGGHVAAVDADLARSEAREVIDCAGRIVAPGMKVRLTRHSPVGETAGIRPLHLARDAADAARLPIMVHPQGAWCDSLDDILAVMRERDILTHCYHGSPHGILNPDGTVRGSVRSALERGVIFDVGHGAGSFSWDVAEQAISQGVEPQTISSDLHVYNVNGPVYDLATTVGKFLHLGLSLDEALRKVTATPARVIRMSDRIGALAVGAWGDAVVLEEQEGDFKLWDTHGQVRIGRRRLVPVMVVRAGRIYRGDAEAGTLLEDACAHRRPGPVHTRTAGPATIPDQ